MTHTSGRDGDYQAHFSITQSHLRSRQAAGHPLPRQLQIPRHIPLQVYLQIPPQCHLQTLWQTYWPGSGHWSRTKRIFSSSDLTCYRPKLSWQQHRSELLKAQTELTAACSDLAEFKGSVNKRLGEQTSHSIARETAVKDGLQQQVNAEGSNLEHLGQRIRANNVVLHGVPDIAAHSRPADLTRYVSNKLDSATPRRGSPSQALSQSIRAVSHIGLHLADELTPKQLKAQKGLEADFSALKLKGFRPFYRRGELKYRDQGVNRTCKRGEAIRVCPYQPPRASPAPPGPPPRGPAPGRQGVRTLSPGRPSPGSTAGGGPAPGQSTAAASTSAAIAAANAATAAAANAMAGNGDTEMPAPSSGPGASPSALAPSQ
ncbi:TPA: hypothetical protein ACH3X1_011024 [Trebouxia sp. C0004]